MKYRSFKSALAGGVAAIVLTASGMSACAEDLIIHNIASMSGSQASFGEQAEKGARLAVETAGQIAGMDAKMVTLDSESDPGKAARKVKEALAKEGPGLFVGSTLSSTALAVGKEVHGAGGIYINGSGADEITGSDCNSAMYRWSAPTYGAVNASLRPVLEQNPNIKKVFTITPQYVFGEAMLANSKAVLDEKGVELVGNAYHSLKDKEFSGIIAQAQAAQPDLLLLLNFGSQAAATIQQAINFGLKDRMKILLVWSNGLDTMQSLGSDVSDGIYFGAQYWHEEEAPGNQAFVKLSREKMDMTPNYPMAHYYQMTKLLLDAVSATGGTDMAKLRAHLEGLEYEGITGAEKIRTDNHQVEKAFYLLKGKPKSEMTDADDFADVVSKGTYVQTAEESGCHMQ